MPWWDPAVQGWLHVLGASSAASAAGPAAGKDREEEDRSDSGPHPDNDVSVLQFPTSVSRVGYRKGREEA